MGLHATDVCPQFDARLLLDSSCFVQTGQHGDCTSRHGHQAHAGGSVRRDAGIDGLLLRIVRSQNARQTWPRETAVRLSCAVFCVYSSHTHCMVLYNMLLLSVRIAELGQHSVIPVPAWCLLTARESAQLETAVRNHATDAAAARCQAQMLMALLQEADSAAATVHRRAKPQLLPARLPLG